MQLLYFVYFLYLARELNEPARARNEPSRAGSLSALNEIHQVPMAPHGISTGSLGYVDKKKKTLSCWTPRPRLPRPHVIEVVVKRIPVNIWISVESWLGANIIFSLLWIHLIQI
jgi:hypothetical protein